MLCLLRFAFYVCLWYFLIVVSLIWVVLLFFVVCFVCWRFAFVCLVCLWFGLLVVCCVLWFGLWWFLVTCLFLRVDCFSDLMFWLLLVYLFMFDCYVICLGLFVLGCFFGVVIVFFVRFLSFICFEFCDCLWVWACLIWCCLDSV